MKNYTLIAIILVSFITSSFAQELKKVTAETQFRVVNLANTPYIPNLKFRYFINEKSAIRTTFDYNSATSIREINEVDGDGIGTVEKNNTLLAFSLGYEHHFKTDKVSPYVGAELKVFSGNINEFGSRTDSVVFIPNFNYTSKRPVSGFGFHLFTGVDVDISKTLFVGTELGFAFQSIQQKRGTFNTKDASSLSDADVTTDIPSLTNSTFSLINVGVVRLGWRF